MYHENVRWGMGVYGCISYYDNVEEIPDMCIVNFPGSDGRNSQVMTMREMLALAESEGWYVVVADHNFGVCDHWVCIPFKRWINERYTRIIRYVDDNKNTLGYARQYKSVILTKDKTFRKSEVWNS